MTTVTPIPTKPFISAVSGVSFRQEWVRDLKVNEPVFLHRDPDNRFDAHAIRVENRNGVLLGFVPRAIAERLSAQTAARWSGQVVEILRNQTWGIRIRITPVDSDYPELPDVAAQPLETPEEAKTDEVYSASGRLLGTLVRKTSDVAMVRNLEGKTRAYPLHRISMAVPA
mgnify:CR=1 FL=1